MQKKSVKATILFGICAVASLVAREFLLGGVCVAICAFYLLHEPKSISDPLDEHMEELRSSFRKRRSEDERLREAMENIDREFDIPDVEVSETQED